MKAVLIPIAIFLSFFVLGCSHTSGPTVLEVVSVVYPVEKSIASDRHGNIGVEVRMKMQELGVVSELRWDGDLQRDDRHDVKFGGHESSLYALWGRFEFGRARGNPDILILTLKREDLEVARFSTALEFK